MVAALGKAILQSAKAPGAPVYGAGIPQFCRLRTFTSERRSPVPQACTMHPVMHQLLVMVGKDVAEGRHIAGPVDLRYLSQYQLGVYEMVDRDINNCLKVQFLQAFDNGVATCYDFP